MKLTPLRIWDWRLKLAYVVVAYGMGWALHPLVVLLHDPGFFGGIWNIAAIVGGARIFRGADEDVAAPRAWWRMTSRVTMSRRLGILSTVFAALTAVDAPLLYLLPMWLNQSPYRTRILPEPSLGAVVGVAFGSLVFAAIAYLYLNSARRLGWRTPTPVPAAVLPDA